VVPDVAGFVDPEIVGFGDPEGVGSVIPFVAEFVDSLVECLREM
jgi:hypothetical protein